jgi:hypothetical protein
MRTFLVWDSLSLALSFSFVSAGSRKSNFGLSEKGAA